MLFDLDFNIEYPSTMSQRELFAIWAEEARAAPEPKAGGIVVDLWKCVGQRRVTAVVDKGSTDMLDQISLDLPITLQCRSTALAKLWPGRQL